MSVEGWKTGTLGKLCKIEIGGTPMRDNPEYWDSQKETDNLWVSIRDMNQRVINDTAEYITNIGVKNSNAKLQHEGTILLSFKLTIGRVAFAGKQLYTNEAIAALQTEQLTHNFLYYGLQQWNLLQDVDQAIKGATLNKTKLNKIEFQYPVSLQEQTQIATILSTIDRAIEQTEALIAKQQRIKTGLMQDLLTKGIDENGNIRSEETHNFKDSPLGRIPVEWEVATIAKFRSKDRSYLRTGPFGSDLNTKHWVEEGIPVLTIGALGEGEIIKEELFYVSKTTANNLKAFRVESGDIVFSRVADIGRSLVIQDEQTGWIISSNLMRIALDKQKGNPSFLYQNIAFNSIIRAQLRVSSNSGGRDIVNGSILSSILFPWPSLDEQKRVNAIMQRIEEKIVILKNQLVNQINCKTGLMQDLLTGKVRVTDLLNQKAAAN